ncbi:MAG: hypothetical protein BHV87_07630 [Clostridiales bacterium 36_14]|nr:MAG: hypothetical protein BHV87_07630 [Clostridiales bacterium 36_14]
MLYNTKIQGKEEKPMGRTRKTYRLSDEVIQLIENRDRTAYPTATDFIEAKLNKPTKDVTELLYQVSMQLEEIKRLVAQQQQEIAEEQKAFF